jgi:hypothetical protein
MIARLNHWIAANDKRLGLQAPRIDCEIRHSWPTQVRTVWLFAKLREDVVRSVTSEDVIANRFLLIGCSGIIVLIVTLLFAAVR